ncbi:MAG: NosD domain-containing protein, partial [Deltaproteobacteria bacterium]
YTENIVISKPLTVKSSKGADAAVVHAAVPGKPVFEVKNVREAEIAGFTATGSLIAGIYINASDNVRIKDNKAIDNGSGIILSSSNNNTLSNNVASSNKQYGIYLKSSSRNTLDKNNVRSNMDTGIFLSSSNYNSLAGNNVNLNKWNGILLWSSHSNTLKGNKALRNMFAIVLSDSNDNLMTGNSTWPNIYIILPIVLVYIGIITYLIQKSLIRFIHKE